MSAWALFFLAVGVAMDAMAVAASRGLQASVLRARDAIAIALCFGGFQVLMPLLGSVLGKTVGEQVAAWDHWIIFVVLSGIGAKMTYDARTHKRDVAAPNTETKLRELLPLAIATSIDAFAVGVTLPMMGASMVTALVMIGVVTTLLSGLGYVFGRSLGSAFGRKLDAFGGLVLIALGVKILIEHLTSTT